MTMTCWRAWPSCSSPSSWSSPPLRRAGGQGINRSLAVLEAMTAAPTELTKELDRSFGERVIEPRCGLRAARPPAHRSRRHRTDPAQARPRRKPARMDRRQGLAGKMVGAVAGVVVGFVIALVSAARPRSGS